MSFRARLTLFFLLIVVLPMVVIAVLASRTAEDASSGKADARLFGGLETATALYEDQLDASGAVAEEIASDPGLSAAIQAGDPAAIEGLAAQADAAAFELRGAGNESLAATGGELFAASTLDLDQAGEQVATLTVSAKTERDYLREVERLTGREAAVYGAGESSVTLGGADSVEVPTSGGADVVVDGREQRVLTADLSEDGETRIALFGPVEEASVFESSPTVLSVLAVFLVIALLLVVYISRHLSQQVAAMLAAAKRIGGGDFSEKVPVIGGERDEMAGLAVEFNKMSDRLSEQMDQLRRQRVEIDRSVRRLGEAFAAGLDREGLLRIVAETAVSACDAEYGLIALSGREGAEVAAGKANAAIEDVVLAAESQADRGGEDVVARDDEDAHALSAALRRIGDPDRSLGVMTIARTSAPFSPAERDVFVYLTGQAATSIENVALHEIVSEQAVTDALTGLANNRAFRDFAHTEAARAQRFRHPLSLLMLDIDDFKKVNDCHGHLQGDEVLRRIGRILKAESRGIDEPARYGGEEFAVALPETDTAGAIELAERVRERIEEEPVPLVDGEGTISVTASLGVATMPNAASDVKGLIAAADVALYEAKRGGKNRVVLATPPEADDPRRPAAATT